MYRHSTYWRGGDRKKKDVQCRGDSEIEQHPKGKLIVCSMLGRTSVNELEIEKLWTHN